MTYSIEDYAADAGRTAGDALSTDDSRLLCAALGLAGEAGEFADEVKKVFFHGHPLNRDKLIKEAGDIMWYVAAASRALDISMTDIAQRNIAKLKVRYPDGWSRERSMNRNDE